MRFPLFIDLTGRPVVVVGGGAVGLRRAAVLRDFGAAVTVVSPALAAPAAGMVHLPRAYAPGDLEGACLAVAAAGSREVNHAVFQEARDRGVLVNVCDCPAECDFFFPAICRGQGLVAGLVGDGSDHKKTARAAEAVRRTLEGLQ